MFNFYKRQIQKDIKKSELYLVLELYFYMSNNLANNKDVPKSEIKEKRISLDIQENIMNNRFMIKTLKSMSKSDHYAQDIVFHSPLGDSMVMKIKCENNKEITLTTKGESGVSLVVTGEHNVVHNFIKDFTIEAVSILATELSQCLKSEIPNISAENLLQGFREKLAGPIKESIKQCVKE